MQCVRTCQCVGNHFYFVDMIKRILLPYEIIDLIITVQLCQVKDNIIMNIFPFENTWLVLSPWISTLNPSFKASWLTFQKEFLAGQQPRQSVHGQYQSSFGDWTRPLVIGRPPITYNLLQIALPIWNPSTTLCCSLIFTTEIK